MSRINGYVVVRVSDHKSRGGGGRITSTQCIFEYFHDDVTVILPLDYLLHGGEPEGVDFSRRGRHVNDHFAMLVNSLQKFLEEQHTNHSLEKQ